MFKVNKLLNVDNEIVDIKTIEYESHNIKNKEVKKYKSLIFDIKGNIGTNNYDLSLSLKNDIVELLKLDYDVTTNYSDNILEGETFLDVSDNSFRGPVIDLLITRFTENKFIVYIKFFTYEEDYSGIIEFTFNIDDYL